MIKFKVDKQNENLILKTDKPEFSLMVEYISFFDKNNFCELYEATKKVLANKLKRYAFVGDIYKIDMTLLSTLIEYNDGVEKNYHGYSTKNFMDYIKIYIDAYKTVYGKDLRVVTEEYCPIIEGIIPEIDEDENKKKMNK